MSEQVSPPAEAAGGAAGISHAGWGLVALWAGLATLMGLAAAAIEPVQALGRGAVVFAGAGAACAVALALAALMFGAAGALAAWRRFGPAAGGAPPARAAPPVLGGEPVLNELVGSLAVQVAQFDKRLDAAMRGERTSGPDGGGALLDAVRESLARAAERFAREQGALDARLKAEAEDAEARTKSRIGALSEAVLPRVNALNDDVARLRRAVVDSEERLRLFEQQVFDLLRARDAGETLKRLDAQASELFEHLFEADERRYATEAAWQADHGHWMSRINEFWDILRGYSTDVEQPFAVTEAEVERAGDVPESPLFESRDMRFCYRLMVVVNERHMNFRENAFSFNAEKARPPKPDAPPPAEEPPPAPPRTPNLAAPGGLPAQAKL